MTPTLSVVLAIFSLATYGAAFAPSPLHLGSPSTIRRPLSPPSRSAVPTSQESTTSRSKHIREFTEWAKENGIQYAGIELSSAGPSGLGLYATRPLSPDAVLLQVPPSLVLSVRSPKDYNPLIEQTYFPDNPDLYRNLPWWAALSLQLHYHSRLAPSPWTKLLPRRHSTPLHWPSSALDRLHYPPLARAVALQNRTYHALYSSLSPPHLSYPDFVWGCETARSRAFSGGSASSFDARPYLTAAFLVTAYLAAGMGTTEQAANGAALVFCGIVWKDFVLPKLRKEKRYVVCPMVDMANHAGAGGAKGKVAWEYFAGGYSLSMGGVGAEAGEEVRISYGERNNDQLLQYYGFVEKDNVHDVYILPPIRQWDIQALEVACGRTIGPGRLEKLDRAGLLGRESLDASSSDVDAANEIGGVVYTRAGGIDPAVLQAVRALVSSREEWENAGEAIGNFASQVSPENERAARRAIRRAMELELESKPTTVEEDERLLRIGSGGVGMEEEELLAIRFRLEKKKVLREAIRNME